VNIKNLTARTKIYFPVYVEGAKLSMGEQSHFPRKGMVRSSFLWSH